MGRADVMLAGGTEAPITEVGIAGFDAMRALSRRNDDPERASRPFDRARDGLVMGEAAAILVLEELEHARARGAKIYGELAGYGVSSDAAHMTEPDPTGANPARAMKMAMEDAGVDPGEVGYINAHATSTPLGDASETRVIKQALGEENALRTPVSSTKGATGHCFGAAGAIEAVFTTLAVHDRKLPPTINYENEDPECDLDYIANESREAPTCAWRSRTRSASAVTTPASYFALFPNKRRPMGQLRLARASRRHRRPPRRDSGACVAACTQVVDSCRRVAQRRDRRSAADDAGRHRRLLFEHRAWLERELAKPPKSFISGLQREDVVWIGGLALPAPALPSLEAWYREQARTEVLRAVERESRRGWTSTYTRVTIRDQLHALGLVLERRGALSFNWRLIVAPPAILTYVVVHELCSPHPARPLAPSSGRVVAPRAPTYKEERDWLAEHGPELLAYRVPKRRAA